MRNASSVVTGSVPFRVRVPKASSHCSSGDATRTTAPGTCSSDMASFTVVRSESTGSDEDAAGAVVGPADELSRPQADVTDPATTTAPTSHTPARARVDVPRGAWAFFRLPVSGIVTLLFLWRRLVRWTRVSAVAAG